MRALFLVLIFALTVFAQSVDRLKVDDYEEGSNSVVIILNSTLQAGQNVTNSSIFTSPSGPNDTQIMGGERDLQYTALSGAAQRVFSTSISAGAGTWEISTPNGATGEVLMQYDSTDNSMNLDVDGFLKITGTSTGLDLTEGGFGSAFHIVLETDIATNYIVSVYSPDGSSCQREINVPPNNVQQDVVLQFSSFTGSCSFTNVGAIEILVEAFENVDTIVTLFSTQGTNPSQTPSPSIGASQSPSPSPVVKECFCQCPAFTCELIFDLDDDQNNAYFFIDDDGFGRSKGYFGGYGYYYADGYGRQSNNSNGLYVSILAIISAFFALF